MLHCFHQTLTDDAFSQEMEVTFPGCDSTRHAKLSTLLGFAVAAASGDYEARDLGYEKLRAMRQGSRAAASPPGRRTGWRCPRRWNDPQEGSTRQALDFIAGRSCTPIGQSSGQSTLSVRSRIELLQPDRPTTVQREVPGAF